MPTNTQSTANRRATPPAEPQEVTRHIKADVTAMLWGRAAGRCEFWGCNKPLWESAVTRETVNLAQRAHIYSFSSGGPRGNRGVLKEELNDFNNLMLVCHGCHQTIDKHKDGGRYTVELLKQWKEAHERRIETVTGIDPAAKSHIVFYGANIGDHSSPLHFDEAAEALFPVSHPADNRAIELGTINSALTDRTTTFWEREAEHLKAQFDRRVRDRIADGDMRHVSVFALAPQPLLVLLGTLMIDITNAHVYQRHREPQTWKWPDEAPPVAFDVKEPVSRNGTPVLVLELSAKVSDDRITNVLGNDVSIWRVAVAEPNTDLIKSRQHLADFRAVIRPLLDRIKGVHGQTSLLHVFPVVGVSVAVELGRVRMPKAHMPWLLYDQINARGGFVPALTISPGEK